jgi:hypothetical protein
MLDFSNCKWESVVRVTCHFSTLVFRTSTWTHFDIAPLLTPEGDRSGAFGTITDITALHHLEETRLTLAHERERAAALRADDAEKQRGAEAGRRKAQGNYVLYNWLALADFLLQSY